MHATTLPIIRRMADAFNTTASGGALVERTGLGRAPTAFRIWKAGTNALDGGSSVVFSERSAKMLIAEQASRGRLYSFDFDHRSIMSDAPPEAAMAAGWHALDVRPSANGPELWAVSCAWTEEARAGLESSPPTWKYFSPCYEVDPKTREVTSYVNCALTNNPLTHGIPALASTVAAGPLVRARQRVLALVTRSRKVKTASGVTQPLAKKKATPEECITALRVVANPGSSNDARGKALGMLADHFEPAVAALESSPDEQSSATASVVPKLAAARAKVAALVGRAAVKVAASRVGPVQIGRLQRRRVDTSGLVIEMIRRAGRNSLSAFGKPEQSTLEAAAVTARITADAESPGVIEMIERIGEQTLRAIRQTSSTKGST